MSIRVLIVDDNYVLCKSIEDALHRDGAFDVVGIAGDGVQALDFLRNTEIDLMLLDIVMPQRDGMGVLEGIRENNMQMPVTVVMSSMDNETVIQSFLEKGVIFYFVKPFDADMMVRRLRDLFREEIPEKEAEQDTRLAQEIRQLLHQIAVPPHIMGYRFLEMAIALTAEDPDYIKRMTTDLYPKVAVAFGSTRQRVERAIRHAIEVAWNRARVEDIEELFGYTVDMNKDKPTNSEFIALLADRARSAAKE